MPNTYTQLYYHIVFCTKHRFPFITEPLEERLYPYFNGICANIGCTLLLGNGIADHVHLLIKAPPRISISSILKSIKGDSSKWIHESFPEQKTFEWQVGYSAFSVGSLGVQRVRTYISNQKSHHAGVSFKSELPKLLKKHEVQYDERYIWD